MTTPQITPTPDAVKLAGELAERFSAEATTTAGQAEFQKGVLLPILLPVLTAQQAEHAAVVARLEAASFAYDKLLAIHGTVLEDLSAARADADRHKKNADHYYTALQESEEAFSRQFKIAEGATAQLTALREQAEADRKPVTGETSDGYHTFNELYDHRCTLFLALMQAHPALSWISTKHHDGSVWDGWFIAGIKAPTGDLTYHLPTRMWSLARETGAAILETGMWWDGHTAAQVVERIQAWIAYRAAEGKGEQS